MGLNLGLDLGCDLGLDLGIHLGKDVGLDLGLELGLHLSLHLGQELGFTFRALSYLLWLHLDSRTPIAGLNRGGGCVLRLGLSPRVGMSLGHRLG